MKLIIKLIIPLLLSISTVDSSTAQRADSGIENIKWLVGTWANRTSRGTIYETWTEMNDTELFGMSYIIKEEDTVIFETIRIIEKDGYIQYIPTVKDQNEGKPVIFKSSYISSSKFIVEAPEHDYPQVISYTQIAKNQLVLKTHQQKH